MESMIKSYLKVNRKCYIFLLVCFFGGTAFGAYYTRSYNSAGVKYMTEFFSAAKKIYETTEPAFSEIFKEGLISSVKSSVIVWVAGFTVIGIAVVFALIFKSGFMCGFLSGFLMNIYGGKGIFISSVLIFSKCLIYVPAFLFISCESVKFSHTLVKMISGKYKYRTNFKYYILKYVFMLLFTAAVMIVYALFEAYVCGNILKVYLKS